MSVGFYVDPTIRKHISDLIGQNQFTKFYSKKENKLTYEYGIHVIFRYVGSQFPATNICDSIMRIHYSIMQYWKGYPDWNDTCTVLSMKEVMESPSPLDKNTAMEIGKRKLQEILQLHEQTRWKELAPWAALG